MQEVTINLRSIHEVDITVNMEGKDTQCIKLEYEGSTLNLIVRDERFIALTNFLNNYKEEYERIKDTEI